MEASRLIGIGGLAGRVNLSPTRIRQLERTGVIPTAQRLDPGDRRVWPAEDVDAIRDRLKERRATQTKQPAASAA
jgi:DNA-binding transcriptional MerR regulator